MEDSHALLDWLIYQNYMLGEDSTHQMALVLLRTMCKAVKTWKNYQRDFFTTFPSNSLLCPVAVIRAYKDCTVLL